MRTADNTPRTGWLLAALHGLRLGRWRWSDHVADTVVGNAAAAELLKAKADSWTASNAANMMRPIAETEMGRVEPQRQDSIEISGDVCHIHDSPFRILKVSLCYYWW